jgi:hypothetical protein
MKRYADAADSRYRILHFRGHYRRQCVRKSAVMGCAWQIGRQIKDGKIYVCILVQSVV